MKSEKEKSSKDKGKDRDEQRLKNEKKHKKDRKDENTQDRKGDVRAGALALSPSRHAALGTMGSRSKIKLTN